MCLYCRAENESKNATYPECLTEANTGEAPIEVNAEFEQSHDGNLPKKKGMVNADKGQTVVLTICSRQP